MAITWNVTISERGVNSGNYVLGATVTDDTKPVGRQTENVSVEGRMDTEEQKEALYAAMTQMYQAQATRTAALATLEAEAKTALEK